MYATLKEVERLYVVRNQRMAFFVLVDKNVTILIQKDDSISFPTICRSKGFHPIFMSNFHSEVEPFTRMSEAVC